MRIRLLTLATAVALAGLLTAACSDNNNSVSPTVPTTSAPTGGGGGGAVVSISITGTNGAQSFSPNPAAVPVGSTVAWVNEDSTVHRIVQDSGAFDTGDITPGTASPPVTISRAGALPYHCSIHPDMVGTIEGTSTPGGGAPGSGTSGGGSPGRRTPLPIR